MPNPLLGDLARRSLRTRRLVLAASLLALACSDDSARILTRETAPANVAGAAGAGGGGSSGDAPASYILSTLVSSGEETLGYVHVLDSLSPEAIDASRPREFSGQADAWVHDGSVFVTNGEDLTITKFSVLEGELIEQDVVSFSAYGLSTLGFWINTFVSSDKAYLLNGTREYIVWNPATMQITGSIALPQPEAPPGFRLFTGYSDRAAVSRDGLLYQPFYWTDESFFLFPPESRIVVVDVATDSIVREIVAPCPGLDYATVDESSNIYFSAWVYAPGGAAVLEQPSTCVFTVPAAGEPALAFDVASLTAGREGGVLRHVGNGRALMSVLHDERFTPSDVPSAPERTFAANWRFWSFDMAAGTAQPLDALDWNAGAQYSFDIDQKTYTLVALADYSATTVYELGESQTLTPIFDTAGWSTRLFRLR